MEQLTEFYDPVSKLRTKKEYDELMREIRTEIDHLFNYENRSTGMSIFLEDIEEALTELLATVSFLFPEYEETNEQ